MYYSHTFILQFSLSCRQSSFSFLLFSTSLLSLFRYLSLISPACLSFLLFSHVLLPPSLSFFSFLYLPGSLCFCSSFSALCRLCGRNNTSTSHQSSTWSMFRPSLSLTPPCVTLSTITYLQNGTKIIKKTH